MKYVYTVVLLTFTQKGRRSSSTTSYREMKMYILSAPLCSHGCLVVETITVTTMIKKRAHRTQLKQADASFAEYFFHIAKLNQLLVLSQQLEEDIRHLGSHKYIAHQLSVIYVSRINHNNHFSAFFFSLYALTFMFPLCYKFCAFECLYFCSKSSALSEEFRLSLKWRKISRQTSNRWNSV